MPRTNRPPAYRLHKARQCAVVTIAGKNHILGPYGSPQSREKYAQLVAEWEASGRSQPPPSRQESPAELRVKDVILSFYRHAQEEYVDENEEPTGEVTSIRLALRRLRRLYGNTSVLEFGPRKLKTLRHTMVAEKLSRNNVNDSFNRIRRMFRWAVSEEIVPVSVYESLKTVAGLSKRRKKSRQSKRVRPVAADCIGGMSTQIEWGDSHDPSVGWAMGS